MGSYFGGGGLLHVLFQRRPASPLGGRRLGRTRFLLRLLDVVKVQSPVSSADDGGGLRSRPPQVVHRPGALLLRVALDLHHPLLRQKGRALHPDLALRPSKLLQRHVASKVLKHNVRRGGDDGVDVLSVVAERHLLEQKLLVAGVAGAPLHGVPLCAREAAEVALHHKLARLHVVAVRKGDGRRVEAGGAVPAEEVVRLRVVHPACGVEGGEGGAHRRVDDILAVDLPHDAVIADEQADCRGAHILCGLLSPFFSDGMKR